MRGWKLLQWGAAFIAVAVLLVWALQGMHVFTKQQRKVVHREEDPLFGTVRERVEWQPDFRLGLDIAGPVAVAAGAAAALGWWRARKASARRMSHNHE
jgi:hypothetical protein